MSQGMLFVIDQLGQTVMQRDATIARLTAENEQLQAQLAAQGATAESKEQE
jgi:hypothetical protein